MVIAGLGMAMVAGTLMTIVLAKIPAQYSGAASSLINTTIQVGVAGGAVVATPVRLAFPRNWRQLSPVATGNAGDGGDVGRAVRGV